MLLWIQHSGTHHNLSLFLDVHIASLQVDTHPVVAAHRVPTVHLPILEVFSRGTTARSVSLSWGTGKSGLHASGEGERVIAPEPW